MDLQPNSSKARLYYLFINKWIKHAMNYEDYKYFEEVSSDFRIVSIKIRMSLHRNKKQTG